MLNPEVKVLLVEDAPDMQLIVKTALEPHLDLHCADTLEAAERALNGNDFSVMILDVGVPDGDGFEFCATIRQNERFRQLPIIFLTGQDSIDHRVLGFERGGDDYVTKPLEPQEFTARVLARAKRRASNTMQTEMIKGQFRVDLSLQRAYLLGREDSDSLNLTPIEFKLLVHFLRNENQIFSREDLLRAVWGKAVHVSGHSVDTHISALRKKVGEQGRCFKAVVKKGYCYTS